MCIPKTLFTSLSVVLLCLSAAAIAQADPIFFTGTREFSGGPMVAPNPVRCGPFPPNVSVTLPTGVGTSNFGAFTSTESHCVNPLEGSIHNLFNGLFTFDFGGGNSFFGTYVGTVFGVPPLPIPPGTVVAVSFTYTVTGGTGSFLNASGTLLGTGTTTFTAMGTNSRIDISTIPEPATVVLLGSGLAGIGTAVRRRRKSHRDEAG